MIRVNSASDVKSGSTTMKVVVFLRLTRYTRACFLAYLISRAHNRTETGAGAGRPVRLHCHAAVQHLQPVSRRGSQRLLHPERRHSNPAALNVNTKSTLAAKLWNSEVTGC
jgi:hypothetical protein